MTTRHVAHGIHAHPTRKLGKRRPSNKPAINFGQHLKAVPPHPLTDPAPNFNYPMDLNDAWGDCVVAGWDHWLEVVHRLLLGAYTNLTEAEILAHYREQNPNFDPHGTASTNGPGSSADGGMDIQVFLEARVKDGSLLGFAKVDYTNHDEMLAAIYLGLGIITGVVVDQAQMQSQFDQGVWDYVAHSPEAGGHCIPIVGYQPVPECVSWAKIVECTMAFIDHQMEEAWIGITQAHADHPQFWEYVDLASFAAAYKGLTGRDFPIPVPAPTPEPSPTPTPAPPAPLVPVADAADKALAPSLKRLLGTMHESHYIHDAATTWLAAKKLG